MNEMINELREENARLRAKVNTADFNLEKSLGEALDDYVERNIELKKENAKLREEIINLQQDLAKSQNPLSLLEMVGADALINMSELEIHRAFQELKEKKDTQTERAEKAESERDELEHKLGLTILTTHESSLNSEVGKRFAIKQRIKELDYFKSAAEANIPDDETVSKFEVIDSLERRIEQLRKELDDVE